MNLSIYRLQYSSLLGVPFLSDVLYRLQIRLIRLGVVHSGWVSRKDTVQRQVLISELRQRADFLFCSAWQLGFQLSDLNRQYIFHFPSKSIDHLSTADLYDLHWSLHFARSVTKESTQALKPILPRSYPLWRTYIICVRDPLEAQCDFVKQTVKQLLQRQSAVVILSHVRQHHVSAHFSGKLGYLTTQPLVRNEALPYRLRLCINWCWNQLVTLRLRRLVNRLHSPLLWCFDPDDLSFYEMCPRQTFLLYDCVDFLTSLNPEVRQRLTYRHDQLLKKAHLVTANSRVLHEQLRQKRLQVVLVPQGFDLEAFQPTKTAPSSKEVTNFFQDLDKKQHQAPIITFVGALSFRIDYRLLLEVIESCPQYIFCLPQTKLPWQSEDSVVKWDDMVVRLHQLPNILWYPQLQRQEVRRLIQQSVVGMIPYNITFEHNKYCFPMKTFEYFYEGLPILSTSIEELKHYPDLILIGDSAKQWKKHLNTLVTKKLTPEQQQQMRNLCHIHAWKEKISRILSAVSEAESLS